MIKRQTPNRDNARAERDSTNSNAFMRVLVGLSSLVFFLFSAEGVSAQDTVIVCPKEIHDVLVNPGMGITTFQRFNGQPLNPPLTWSEEGPTERIADPAQKPEFPLTSVSYCRWVWDVIEPKRGEFRWEIIDMALAEAREHGQTLAIRLMPYTDKHALPDWYRNSGAQNSVKPFHLDEATISDVHAAYKSGALTSVKLVQAYLERIRACDQAGPKLNVVIFLNPRALEEAAALDEHFRRTGKFVGPLHGIPVLLKDNVNTKDMPTTGGSLSLAGYTPVTDAAITKKLRNAGAIILAKVNLHEFAIWGETVSSIQGQTLNPYDLTRTPGGSSGGTGAGVAANFAIAGIGTDTVNSIRSPASANNIVGIRPTLGLVSRAGIIPYSFTQDAAGPLARTVTDAAKMLNVLVGYDPDDPATAWSVGNSEEDYTKFLKANGLQGKRIGVLRSFFGIAPINDEVNIIASQAVQDLKRSGATMVELNTPDLDSGKLSSDISVHLYEFKPAINAYLASGNTPVNSLEEIISSGKFHPNIRDNITKAQGLEMDDGYRLRLQKRSELQQRVMKIMADERLDAIMFPHQKRLVVPIGEIQVERNGALGSVTGFPSIVVPGGFSSPTPTATLGVPVGIEFLGRPWSEKLLVEIGYGYELATKHRRPPPTVPPLLAAPSKN